VLKYLVQVTESLLLTAVLTGMLFGMSWTRWEGKSKRVVGIGCALGWVAALLIAVFKSLTKLVDSGLWNLRFVGLYLVGALLFGLLLVPPLRKRLGDAGELVQQGGVALLLIGATGYTAPEPLTFPNQIILSVQSLVSTDFFFRITGWIAGLLVMYLIALATHKVLVALGERSALVAGCASALIAGLLLCGLALRALLTRRMIPQSPLAFNIAVLASNHVVTVSCVLAGIALVCALVLLVRSGRVREPYDNPAQHRKIRAKWRSRRRWAVLLIACVALSFATVTLIKAYDSQEVELSPSEECELREDACYIPLTQVDDGHLHRFTYESPDGVGIRFIVIKKPGGSAYGIGLDACDICGETGYYERDDQVVCKLCDVVMNISTIGFKGGCNPIVIDYEIHDGYIIVPYSTLLEHEVIFTR